MLGPPGRADVLVNVAFLNANPVHGREVAHRITLVSMEHQFGFGCSPRCEIQEEWIVCLGGNDPVVSGLFQGGIVRQPSRVCPPTRIRLTSASEGMRSMALSSVTTMRAPLRASRSRISLSVARVVVGTMTAPILMAASISSQMAATFGRQRT